MTNAGPALGRRASLIITAALALAGTGRARGAEAAIRVAGVVNDPNVILPLQSGIRLGLFDKVGVKVEFSGYSGGSTAMEAVAAGAADIAVFIPAGTSMAVKQGMHAKIVAVGILGYDGWHLLVKKDSALTTLAQIANKKIGITANGSNTDLLALWAANHANVPIIRVPVGGGGLGPNLLSGNVDAVVAYPPLSYSLINSGNVRSLFDFGANIGKVVQSCWVASDAIIRDNPDGLRKMLVGVFSAVAYMKKNPQWAYDFIRDEMKVDANVAKQEFVSTIQDYSDDGVIKEEWLGPSLDFLKLAGMTDMPSGKAIYTDAFVPAKAIPQG